MKKGRGQKAEVRCLLNPPQLVGDWHRFYVSGHAESGGERAAVQTLREVRMRWASAVASGLRWLQHRFSSHELQEGCYG